MSDSAPPPPAAATVLQTIRPALFLLVPLFSLAHIVLALSHSSEGRRPLQTHIAYAFIASLTVLSTLAGALPLSHAANAQAEALIQAFLSLLLGVAVLHLPPAYVHPRGLQFITGTVHTGLLAIALFSATFLALFVSFLPSAVPSYIPPSLFIAYTLLALLRVSISLVKFLQQPPPPISRPIAIHVATQRTSGSIPLTLPSSTSNFPDGIELEVANHQHRRSRRHEKLPSVDSSTSTITIVNHNRSLTSPIPPPLALSLSSPPASDVEHQLESAQSSLLRSQLLHSRSRSLLVFLLAAQVALLPAYVCSLGASIQASGSASSTLRIVQAACTVLAVTGTMSAYLLHAYNTHFKSQIPLSAPPASRRDSSTANGNPNSRSAPGDNNTPTDTTSIQLVDVSQTQTQPVMISLAPPRRRTDGLGFGSEGRETGYGYGGLEACSPGSTPSSSGCYPPASGPQPSSYTPLLAPPPMSAAPQRRSLQPSSQMTTQREPVILTYEPPKRKNSDRSLFETTDAEAEAGGRYVDSDKSLFSSMSFGSLRSAAASGFSGETKVASAGHAEGKSGAASSDIVVQPSRPTLLQTVSSPAKPSKKKPAEDPATYIKRRGSLPTQPKRFFGWEFGWDPLSKAKAKDAVKVDPNQGSSFIDLRSTAGRGFGLGSGVGGSSTSLPKTKAKETRETRKLKRNTVGHLPMPAPGPIPPSPPVPATPCGSASGAAAGVPFPSPSTPARKLRKRTGGSRPGTADREAAGERRTSFIRVADGQRSPQKHVQAHRRARSASSTASNVQRPRSADSGVGFGGPMSMPSSPVSANSSSNSQSTPKAASNANSRSNLSLPSATALCHRRDDSLTLNAKATPRGLHLKRSFKLGVGRTLGPGLTLGGASTNTARVVGKKAEGDDDGFVDVEEEDGGPSREAEDGESDVHSTEAAKLVSASVARVAPASTVKAPTPLHAPQPKPAAGVTGRWMNHPFAETVEEAADVVDDGAGDADADTDAEFVMLERELEELRGRFADFRSDADGEDGPTIKTVPALRITTTTHVPTQTPTPVPTPDKAKARTLAKPRPKQNVAHRKRVSVSKATRPAVGGAGNVKSEWAPQSSASASAASSPSASASASPALPYKFPMFFPNALVPSGSSSIYVPPSPQAQFLHPQSAETQHTPTRGRIQPRSAPSTPRSPTAIHMTIGSVRSAFAGVGARMSSATARMSGASNANSPLGAPGAADAIMEDSDGDFMDLRDPFASPPPSTSKVRRSTSAGTSRGDTFWSMDSSSDGHGIEDVFGSGGGNVLVGAAGIGRKMSSWGRLPMPVRSVSSPVVPVTVNGPSSSRRGANISGTRPSGKPRKHKREKRTRKTTLTSLASVKGVVGLRVGGEDADFDVEEALLAQRLLTRLDSDGWEGRNSD